MDERRLGTVDLTRVYPETWRAVIAEQLDREAESLARQADPLPDNVCEGCGARAPFWDHPTHGPGCPRQPRLIVGPPRG